MYNFQKIILKIETVRIKLNKTTIQQNDESNTNTELLNACLADSQWLIEVNTFKINHLNFGQFF
jgi:hypothetical protein